MDYVPIDCGFHDRLESLAARRMSVPMEITHHGFIRVIEARIADIYSRDGSEYARLVTVDGSEIVVRLDQIVSVASIPRPGAA